MGQDRQYLPGTQSDTTASLSWGKYDDMRMPWVGRNPGFERYIAVTDAGVLLAPVDDMRVWIVIQNVGANPLYLNFNEPALAAYPSMILYANGGSLMLDRNTPWPGSIYGVTGAGLSTAVCVNSIVQVTANGRGE